MTRDSYTAYKQTFKCTKYNYLYTSVNTSGSHSTPQGVDGQVDSNRMSVSHKESTVSSAELGGSDTGQLGPTNSTGVSNRSDPHSTSVTYTTSNRSVTRKHALVTQEVQKLLSKGAIVESIPSPMSFISQIFLVEKRGGATTSDQPKGFEPICASITLQNGGSSPDTRLTPTRGLDGENGFERCLPPNSNTSRSPTSPPIHLGAEALQIPVPSIWPLLCTMSFHKTTETSGGLLKADRLMSNSVSGRYVVHAHQQGSARGNGTSDLQNFRSPWLDGEYKEIPSKSNLRSRVSGFSDQFPNNDIQSTIRKGQKNSAGSSESAQISVNFSETPSCLHRESCSSFQGRHTCPITLQSSTKSTQLCNIRAQPPGMLGQV